MSRLFSCRFPLLIVRFLLWLRTITGEEHSREIKGISINNSHLNNNFFSSSYCREFYYIQMEKYARQANTDGVQSADDLQVTNDSELYRHLNLHYNRNNHIEVREVRKHFRI